MTTHTNPDQQIGILRETIVALVRSDGPDLSARQLAVLLTVYLGDGPHTVRGLAADLQVSKPAITRALDRLGELDLARRKVDPADRRSVLVQRTAKGAAFLDHLRAHCPLGHPLGKEQGNQRAAEPEYGAHDQQGTEVQVDAIFRQNALQPQQVKYNPYQNQNGNVGGKKQ